MNTILMAPIGNATGFMAALISSLLAVILLSPDNIITLFVVLGQAHFFITYLYQWRAGKIGLRFILLYAIVGGVLLGLLSYAPNRYALFLVMTGIIFAMHFFLDEFYHGQTVFTYQRVLIGIGFVAMYGLLLLREGYGFEFGIVPPVLVFCSLLPFAIDAYRRRSINPSEMLIMTSTAVLMLIGIARVSISIEAMLGFIILFHYGRWYLFYFFKFVNLNRKLLLRYSLDILIINLIIFEAYMLYSILPQAESLSFLFDRTYFFAWTIMHIVFSLNFERLQTLRAPQSV